MKEENLDDVYINFRTREGHSVPTSLGKFIEGERLEPRVGNASRRNLAKGSRDSRRRARHAGRFREDN